MCVCYPLFGVIIVICNIMSIIIVFIIMYIYYLTVYMFCISCYGTNKLLLCDFCTFVQINSITKNIVASVLHCGIIGITLFAHVLWNKVY